MDIKKEKLKSNIFTSKKFKVALMICFLLILMLYFSMSWRASVNRNDVLLGSVKMGDLNVEVEGYGELKSSKQRLITAVVDATVKEIILKPGALVTPESVIAKLENPILVQDLLSAKQKLAQLEAELRQLTVNLHREAITEEAELADVEFSLLLARAYLDAQNSVYSKGVISKLEYEKSQINVYQLEKRFDFKVRKLNELKIVHKESLLIQEERINQQKGELANIRNKLDSLTVISGMDGVLQKLPIELGQSINSGQELALIGGTKDLVAFLNIPQTQAGLIAAGMSAVVDNRAEKVEGVVERIDPSVTKNSVTVEISLLHPFSNAKVGQNVDGKIIIETIKDTAYIERPIGVNENTSRAIFKLDKLADRANRCEVQFGKIAGKYIQVVSPVKSGETFLLSDLSYIAGNELNLKN